MRETFENIISEQTLCLAIDEFQLNNKKKVF